MTYINEWFEFFPISQMKVNPTLEILPQGAFLMTIFSQLRNG